MDGGAKASAMPIYNKFIDIAKQVSINYISMIMPARWYSGGKGLDDFRERMLKDHHISSLYDYSDSKDVFPSVEIAGGICYFLYDSQYKGECNVVNCLRGERNYALRCLNTNDILVRDNYAINIIKKINSHQNLDSTVFSRNVFSLASNVRGSKDKKTENIELLSSDGISYIEKNKITNNIDLIDKYKVIITYAMSGGNKPNADGKYQILSSLMVLNPNEVCTETFLVIKVSNNIDEANNIKQYLATKFSRYLLLQSLSSIHITKASFRFVPLQNFTSKSDIDWSKSVSEIDHQLYTKYGLTEKEISFIESMIKEM
jgi:site-specific DNA-methyltransferase (adenine-specific)